MPRLGAIEQYLDSNGDPLNGGKLYFYEPGTTVLQDTYSDAGLTTPNTNPVVLGADGRQPDIYFDGSIKVVLKDANGVTLETVDAISGESLTAAEVKSLYESNANTNAFTNADEAKLDGIEALADVTDATNVMAALDGAAVPSATLATTDKLLFQDADASDALKQDTVQGMLDLTLNRVWDYTTLADGGYIGESMAMVAGETLTAFTSVTRGGATARYVYQTDQSGSSYIFPFGLCMNAAVGGNPVTVLLHGFVRNDSWAWTPGAIIYAAGSGILTETKPSTTGHQIIIVGQAMSADIVYVDPRGPVEVP